MIKYLSFGNNKMTKTMIIFFVNFDKTALLMTKPILYRATHCVQVQQLMYAPGRVFSLFEKRDGEKYSSES